MGIFKKLLIKEEETEEWDQARQYVYTKCGIYKEDAEWLKMWKIYHKLIELEKRGL